MVVINPSVQVKIKRKMYKKLCTGLVCLGLRQFRQEKRQRPVRSAARGGLEGAVAAADPANVYGRLPHGAPPAADGHPHDRGAGEPAAGAAAAALGRERRGAVAAGERHRRLAGRSEQSSRGEVDRA